MRKDDVDGIPLDSNDADVDGFPLVKNNDHDDDNDDVDGIPMDQNVKQSKSRFLLQLNNHFTLLLQLSLTFYGRYQLLAVVAKTEILSGTVWKHRKIASNDCC